MFEDYNETVATKVAIQKLWKKRFYNQAIKLCSLPEFSIVFWKTYPMNTESNTASISEKIRAAFEEKGRRKTQARDRIATRLAELAASGQDFSVEELWHDLQRVDAEPGAGDCFPGGRDAGQHGIVEPDRVFGWKPYLPGLRG